MKKLPIGIQTFSELIKENYVYVDKTPYIYRLMQGKYYFLSRPRRFGKSLLITTLKEIFSGNRELFKDLWIYDKIAWEKHPVIHMDFSSITHSEGRENFKNNINYFLDACAADNNITLIAKDNKEKFHELVKKLHEKYGKVVVLIDEYDKPIIDHIEDTAKALENKEVLAGFYEVIKYLDGYLKFVFITGVSKFSKVSIFSKLNNLADITIGGKFAEIAGYTQAELESYFPEYIELLGRETKLDQNGILQQIKHWYNGYSWNEGKNTVYNPFAILNLFYKNKFQNYWFQTATPTFLIKLIRDQKIEVADFEGYLAGEALFESFDLEQIHPASLLFQTGYLTIKKEEDGLYEFGYPNFEVRESFLTHLMADFGGMAPLEVAPVYKKMLGFLNKREFKKFETALVSLFAGIPSQLHLNYESYYHSLIYLLLALLGAEINLEENTDKGRIDAVLELNDVIYVIEFKLDKAVDAMEQIREKRYYEKYLADGRKIVLLGVGGFREKQIQVVSEVLEK